jgi:general stress protein YciG
VWLVAKKKNPHAVALGRLGGKKGGLARAKNLSAEQRSEIGRKGGLVGGKARAKALTPEQRSAIAKKAGRKSGQARKKKDAG